MPCFRVHEGACIRVHVCIMSKQCDMQDLVSELLTCREKLASTEDQLDHIKSYMDKILLRIMDTNPAILSAFP